LLSTAAAAKHEVAPQAACRAAAVAAAAC
jgi:hypothetical protein